MHRGIYCFVIKLLKKNVVLLFAGDDCNKLKWFPISLPYLAESLKITWDFALFRPPHLCSNISASRSAAVLVPQPHLCAWGYNSFWAASREPGQSPE